MTYPPCLPRAPTHTSGSPSTAQVSFVQQRLWLLQQASAGRLDLQHSDRTAAYRQPRRGCVATCPRRSDRPTRSIAHPLHRKREGPCRSSTRPARSWSMSRICAVRRRMWRGWRGACAGRVGVTVRPGARSAVPGAAVPARRAKARAAALTMHHIVCDGWSMGVLTRELAALYAAFARRAVAAAAAADPVRRLRGLAARVAAGRGARRAARVLASAAGGRCRRCWSCRPTVRDPPVPELSRRAASAVGCRRSSRAALQELSQREGATLFMTLLAAFQVLLPATAGRTTSPSARRSPDRTAPELEGLIGFFVNTLVLRTDLSGDPTFSELLGARARGALGRLRAPGPAVREAGRGARPGARSQPQPAVPGHVRAAEQRRAARCARRTRSRAPRRR